MDKYDADGETCSGPPLAILRFQGQIGLAFVEKLPIMERRRREKPAF